MSKLDSDEAVIAFALATFQVGVFILLAVLTLHLTGSLGELLSELSTTIGLGAFVLLWIATCFCTYMAVRELGLRHSGVPVSGLLVAGTSWGARNGIIVLMAPLLVASPYLAIDALLSNGIVECGRVVVALGLFAVFGGAIATTVGACVGFVGALVIAALWEIARGLAQTGRPRTVQAIGE